MKELLARRAPPRVYALWIREKRYLFQIEYVDAISQAYIRGTKII